MSKTKDKLFSEITKLSKEHGFTVDKEMLEKAITEQRVSSLTSDELIYECRKLLLKTHFSGNREDYDLLSELINRYTRLNLYYNHLINKDKTIPEQTNTSEVKDDESVGDSERKLVIHTVKGDIPVKIIKPDEMNNKLFNDKISSYYDEFLSHYFSYRRR